VNQAGCFDGPSVESFYDSTYSYRGNAAITGVSSTSANEIDTGNLLLTFTSYMSSQRATIEATFTPAKLDHYQFLTHKDFDSSTVGLAYTYTMCTQSLSGNVVQADSPSTGYVASITAHEMGHNFGMDHDTTSPCNVNSIMSPCT